MEVRIDLSQSQNSNFRIEDFFKKFNFGIEIMPILLNFQYSVIVNDIHEGKNYKSVRKFCFENYLIEKLCLKIDFRQEYTPEYLAWNLLCLSGREV